MRAPVAVLVAALWITGGCGTRVVELDPRDGQPPDAGVDSPVTCIPGATQCTNCEDDDDDGFVDGFDLECTGAWDDDEGGFETGTAGDGNVQRQDCFFDDNSGFDEGCDIHACCELVDCPADIPGPPFDPATDCEVTPDCVTYCKPATPPGCDCFGCCTVCPPLGDCIDIYIHPGLAPDCDADTLADPVACPRCEQDPACVQPCGGSTCILCPGQTLGDLPPACTGAACPGDAPTCGGNADCAADEFCSGGCCVVIVQ